MQDSIYKVVAHPKDSSFVLFQVPSIVNEEYSTEVTTFDITSNFPKSTQSVPFGLRNVIWNSTSRRAGYNLVGVTHSWKVVSIGDSVQMLNDEGLAAKSLSVNQQPQKKTLFQDIFGASAFAVTAPEVSAVSSLLRNDSRLPNIFNTPAYLAPSLESLFDPLMKSMLVIRPAEEVGPSTEDVEEDEDVAMEDEPRVSASTSAAQSSRMPVPGEMDALVKLFKKHCMTGKWFPYL